MKHLFKRLYRAVLTLVENIKKEFSNSEFKPRFFELEIGERDISTPSPITFESKNGTKITLYGKIDRVDTYERDGNVYVRVVDYKTGSKDFSLDTLDYGINMQMLIYLFSIWKTENELFKKRLGRKDEGEIIPAGVLYMTASVDDARSDSLDEAEIEKATDKKFSRSGLFLNDESILRAMDREFKYIPIKLTKAGELSPKKALASASDFGEILKKIEDVLSTLCDEMKAGRIDAVPVNTPKITSPCTYCNLRPICRQKAVKKKGF
ncbi:MAG: PD-(D/E)XK nuclease family protein [Clostridia bacterium]|nr:PD-(D/E)XK nuclease family protein [Clostridia bacterium]